MRRVWWALLLLGAAWLLGFSPANAAGPANGIDQPPSAGHVDPDDEILFSMRVGGTTVGNGTRGFTTAAGLCVDLRDVIAGLDLPLVLDAAGSAASGWVRTQDNRVTINFAAREVRFGKQAEAIAAKDVWVGRSGPCILVAKLGRWLDLVFEPDLPNAILQVSAPGGLPLEAAEKRARSAARLRPKAGANAKNLRMVVLPYRLWRTPALDFNIGASVERTSGAGVQLNRDFEVLASGELAWLSANARLASDNRGRPRSLRLRLYRDDSFAALLGPLHATTFALGDVASYASSLTSVSVSGRGGAISNRPLGSSDRPDIVDFTGPLPRGWDVELYRNGELIRSSTDPGSGRYEFRDIPLQSGPNDFDIVQYGPQGQVSRSRRSYQVGAQTPAHGETWWAMAAVDGNHDLFGPLGPVSQTSTQRGWRFDVTAQHGFGKGIAIGAQFHDLVLSSGQRTSFIEANANATVLGAFAEVGVARAADGGSAARFRALGRLFGINFSLESLRNKGLTSERLTADQRAVTHLALDKSVRLGGHVLPIHFDLQSTVQAQVTTLQVQGRVSLTTRKMAISTALAMTRVTSASGPDHADWDSDTLFNGRIGTVRIRGDMRWKLAPRPALDLASIAATIRAADRQTIVATAGYDGAGRTAFGQLEWTRNVGFADLSLRGQVDSRGGFSAGVGLRFGIGPNEFGRLGRISAAPHTTTGQISMRTFRDLNGNGIHDPGEPYEPSPGMIANDVPVNPEQLAGSGSGSQMLQRLEPAIPVALSLNREGFADPLDIPSTPGALVAPRAGLVTPVEFGITGTVTIEGSLRQRNGQAANHELELVRSDGTVAFRFMPDTDGFFSIEQVRYGVYQLRTARDQHAIGGPITATGRTPTLRLGNLVYERAQDASGVVL